MSRRPRFPTTGLPLHVVQRGNDRRPCFFDELDYRIYLRALAEASRHYGVLVHAYVLMTNHVHLLVTPMVLGAASRLMQSVAARYVWHVNASKSRTGTLWEGRYKACLVDRDQYVLAACRYIDLNPVRAGMVRHPCEYPWSSYSTLAQIRVEPLVVPHDALAQLGSPRGAAYARWCAQGDVEQDLDRLRTATGRELVFGSERFKAQIAASTLHATNALPRGRRPREKQIRG
jgi:putative transposase